SRVAKARGVVLGFGDLTRTDPGRMGDEKRLHAEVHMVRLLGWGDEAVSPRAADRGFVPRLEALDERLTPGFGKVKCDFVPASGRGVAVQQAPGRPPAVSLLAAPTDPAGATGPTGPVQVLGDGEAGFDQIWVGGSVQETPVRVGKASPILF